MHWPVPKRLSTIGISRTVPPFPASWTLLRNGADAVLVAMEINPSPDRLMMYRSFSSVCAREQIANSAGKQKQSSAFTRLEVSIAPAPLADSKTFSAED